MVEYMGLPLFDVVVDEEKEKHGTKKVSFVSKPANQMPMLKFSDQSVRFEFNEERRLVTVVIMQPDFPIFRHIAEQQFYVKYTAEQIEIMRDKFMQEQLLDSVNVDHKTDVEGVQMVETWIVDSSRGIKAPEGLEAEDGTWMATFRVHNDEVWASVVDGTYAGVSLEGFFNLVPTEWWCDKKDEECKYSEQIEINAESYTDYPKEASENAKIALRYAEENGWGDCGTDVGKARANQLAKGEPISEETIARMASFARHRQNSDKELGDGCGRLMWLAWGGDAGIEWAQRKLSSIRGEEFSEKGGNGVTPPSVSELKSILASEGGGLKRFLTLKALFENEKG